MTNNRPYSEAEAGAESESEPGLIICNPNPARRWVRDGSRMWPEWDLFFERVLVALPHEGTDWAPRLAEMQDFYINRLIPVLLEAGYRVQVVVPPGYELPKHYNNCWTLKYLTNDTWIRDYGPISVDELGGTHFLNFRFNGWGGKFEAERDNDFNHHLPLYLKHEVRDHLDIVLEGGSIEVDGKGTVMTTASCMMNPNRNGFATEEEMKNRLGELLGAKRWIILHHGNIAGDDTDGHIDTLARFAPHDTILYVKNPDDPEMVLMEEELKAARTAKGEPYRLIPLPSPDPILDEDGQPMPATYANFLAAFRSVIVPTYGQPEKDAQACEAVAKAFSDRKILTLDCRPLIWQHGSLHCATMQWPELSL